jgi:hypothetical protein
MGRPELKERMFQFFLQSSRSHTKLRPIQFANIFNIPVNFQVFPLYNSIQLVLSLRHLIKKCHDVTHRCFCVSASAVLSAADASEDRVRGLRYPTIRLHTCLHGKEWSRMPWHVCSYPVRLILLIAVYFMRL